MSITASKGLKCNCFFESTSKMRCAYIPCRFSSFVVLFFFLQQTNNKKDHNRQVQVHVLLVLIFFIGNRSPGLICLSEGMKDLSQQKKI